MKILFLGGGKRYSLIERFYTAAKKECVELHTASYDLHKEVHVAPLVDKVYVGYPFATDEFREDVNNLKEQFDIIIPCMDMSTVVMSEIGISNVCSSHEICKTFTNKRLAKEWFIKHEVPTPKSKVEPETPFIVKPVFGFGSKDIHIYKDIVDEHWAEAKYFDNSDYIVEEYIEGQEYTIDAYKSPTNMYISIRKRLLVMGGEVVNSITVHNPRIEYWVRRIMNHKGFKGPVTLQCIENGRGVYFTEINPRFGGGVILTIEAGYDYPRMIIREHLGLPPLEYEYKQDLLMLRSMRETFFENYSH